MGAVCNGSTVPEADLVNNNFKLNKLTHIHFRF